MCVEKLTIRIKTRHYDMFSCTSQDNITYFKITFNSIYLRLILFEVQNKKKRNLLIAANIIFLLAYS